MFAGPPISQGKREGRYLQPSKSQDSDEDDARTVVLAHLLLASHQKDDERFPLLCVPRKGGTSQLGHRSPKDTVPEPGLQPCPAAGH